VGISALRINRDPFGAISATRVPDCTTAPARLIGNEKIVPSVFAFKTL
jgi:hypothetical protein